MESAVPLSGHGNLYAAGTWLADAAYVLFNPQAQVPTGDRLSVLFKSRICITRGEVDMTQDPHLLLDLVLELEDGRWCWVVPVLGNPSTGVYFIELLSDLEPPPRPLSYQGTG